MTEPAVRPYCGLQSCLHTLHSASAKPGTNDWLWEVWRLLSPFAPLTHMSIHSHWTPRTRVSNIGLTARRWVGYPGVWLKGKETVLWIEKCLLSNMEISGRIQMAHKHVIISLIIMYIQTTLRNYFSFIRLTESQLFDITLGCRAGWKQALLYISGMQSGITLMEDDLEIINRIRDAFVLWPGNLISGTLSYKNICTRMKWLMYNVFQLGVVFNCLTTYCVSGQ